MQNKTGDSRTLNTQTNATNAHPPCPTTSLQCRILSATCNLAPCASAFRIRLPGEATRPILRLSTCNFQHASTLRCADPQRQATALPPRFAEPPLHYYCTSTLHQRLSRQRAKPQAIINRQQQALQRLGPADQTNPRPNWTFKSLSVLPVADERATPAHIGYRTTPLDCRARSLLSVPTTSSAPDLRATGLLRVTPRVSLTVLASSSARVAARY